MQTLKIQTQVYQNDDKYKGPAFELTAVMDGKTYQKVGQVSADGQLKIDLPAEMPVEVLTERAPGMLGGTLALEPGIKAEKDGHALYIVYVNQDMGPYKAGWSYANDQHQPISPEEASTYRWVI